MKKLFSLGSWLVLLLFVCGSGLAHDTFIMPEKFRVSKGETVKIGFHSADAFPESTGAPKRLQEPSVHTAKGSTPITLSEDGKRWAGTITLDPYSLKKGESLPVRVLFKGAPAPGLQVMAASTLEGASKNKTVGKTDAQGRISIPVASGQWRLHTLLMERTSDPKAEWESFRATLTFEVR